MLKLRSNGNRKRSLILITVDCLRADHCGIYGYSRPTTPFLDSLAPESFVVPQAIVGGAPTYYSFPTIFASRMPLALGRDVVGLAPGEDTLATALHDSGYATAAFSAANPYISPRFGYDQGFEVFQDFLGLHSQIYSVTQAQEKSRGGWRRFGSIPEHPTSPPVSARGKLNRSLQEFSKTLGLGGLYDELYFQYCMKLAPPAASMDDLRCFPSANILVDQAQSWLASIGEGPFFLWLHLMDPHSPYYPPKESFRDLMGEEIDPNRARYLNEYWKRSDLKASGFQKKRQAIVELYDAGIRSVDQQISRLVGTLKQTQRWDDCVLALTADHGEEFLDHGGRFHAPVSLKEEIIRVPLLIRVPGELATKVPRSPMSHLHLAPTLLDIVGVKAPVSYRGRSLWANLQEGTAWDGFAIVESAYDCKNPLRSESRIAPRLLGVRDSRFKLVLRIEPGAVEELYDLETDRTEMSPCPAGADRAMRARLLRLGLAHVQEAVLHRDPLVRFRARLHDLKSEILVPDSSAKMEQPKS